MPPQKRSLPNTRTGTAATREHLASDIPPFPLDRTPGRRLRIGYVSADFRQHAVAMFAEPLLAAHDRVERRTLSLCGRRRPRTPPPNASVRSAITGAARSACSDAKLAELIRADQIDVLVDLAGHTAGNRLLTFARRPAPVQVAYLLGHGYSTGLSAMDAFLADDSLAPEGADALFSERLVRLPRIPLAYAPPEDMPPVAPLPALSNGYVTFGHFGRTERLNDSVVATWARILHAVPRSRLILDNRPFQEAAFRDLFLARFACAWHRSGKARSGLFNARSRAPGPPTAISTSRWIRFRTMPARRPSRRCGRACPSCPWRAGRRSAGSAPASCTRSGSTTGSPATPTPMSRAPWRPRPTSPRSRNCVRDFVSGSPRRRCATQPASRAPSSTPSERYGTNGCEGDVARLHRLYTEGDLNRCRRLGAAHAAT